MSLPENTPLSLPSWSTPQGYGSIGQQKYAKAKTGVPKKLRTPTEFQGLVATTDGANKPGMVL